MEKVGTVILEGDGLKEKSISDESIQKLFDSESYEDKRLGRLFLLKKYPEILKTKELWDNKIGWEWVFRWRNIEKFCNIKPNDPTHTGFIMSAEDLDTL